MKGRTDRFEYIKNLKLLYNEKTARLNKAKQEKGINKNLRRN